MRVLAVLCLVWACGDPESEPPVIAPANPEAERPQLVDEPPSAWPVDLTDLRASIEEFETRARCEQRLRAQMPVELAETLADLGYDAVLRDICIGLDAAKQDDEEICNESSVRTTREGCLRRLAIHAGKPDLCPSARGVPGRDPLCVAWAARAPRQCLALTGMLRQTCESVLKNDAEGCDEDDNCMARVERYGSVAETEFPDAFPDTEIKLTLRAERVAEHTFELNEGVHLAAAEGCAHEFVLDVGELFRDQPRFRLKARLAAESSVERARLMLPGGIRHGDLNTPTLTVSESRARGDQFTLSLRGVFRRDGQETPVELSVNTWIRDAEPLSDCPD